MRDSPQAYADEMKKMNEGLSKDIVKKNKKGIQPFNLDTDMPSSQQKMPKPPSAMPKPPNPLAAMAAAAPPPPLRGEGRLRPG